MRLVLLRQLQVFAEMLGRLVDGESRSFGRDLKQNSSRLAKINGVKIFAIHHRADGETKIDQRFAPLQLLFIVRCPERDVMHRACGNVSRRIVRPFDQIQLRAGRSSIERKTAATPLLRAQFESERLGQQLLGRRRILQLQSRRVKSAHRQFLRHCAFECKIDIVVW